jgi:hypothetical protein
MKNILDKSSRENQNRFLCSVNFPQNCAAYDNVEEHGAGRQTTDDNVIGRMRIAYRITKAKDTHPEYVILLSSPLQQRLSESVSILCVHCCRAFIL